MILLMPLTCFADYGRVILRASDGKLIQFQSGGSTPEHLETMYKNATNKGYKRNEVIVKFVNEPQWLAIKGTWIDKPVKDKDKIDKDDAKVRKDAFKAKYGWDNNDIKALKKILKYE